MNSSMPVIPAPRWSANAAPPVTTVAEAVAAFDRLQRQMTRLWGHMPFSTGVHRFKDWEEFETWKTNRMMQKSPARR